MNAIAIESMLRNFFAVRVQRALDETGNSCEIRVLQRIYINIAYTLCYVVRE